MPGRRRAARFSRHHGRSRAPSFPVHRRSRRLIQRDGRVPAGTRARRERDLWTMRSVVVERHLRAFVHCRPSPQSIQSSVGTAGVRSCSLPASAADGAASVAASSAPASTTAAHKPSRGRDFRPATSTVGESGTVAHQARPAKSGGPRGKSRVQLRDGCEMSSREPFDNGCVGDWSDARSLSGHERCRQVDGKPSSRVLSNDCSTTAPRHAEQPSAQATGPSWTEVRRV